MLYGRQLNLLGLQQNCEHWRHFQTHFIGWKCLYFDLNVAEIGSKWHQYMIRYNKPKRLQAITWTNVNQLCIAPLSYNELTSIVSNYHVRDTRLHMSILGYNGFSNIMKCNLTTYWKRQKNLLRVLMVISILYKGLFLPITYYDLLDLK